jgi:hypothetical protein
MRAGEMVKPASSAAESRRRCRSSSGRAATWRDHPLAPQAPPVMPARLGVRPRRTPEAERHLGCADPARWWWRWSQAHRPACRRGTRSGHRRGRRPRGADAQETSAALRAARAAGRPPPRPGQDLRGRHGPALSFASSRASGSFGVPLGFSGGCGQIAPRSGAAPPASLRRYPPCVPARRPFGVPLTRGTLGSSGGLRRASQGTTGPAAATAAATSASVRPSAVTAEPYPRRRAPAGPGDAAEAEGEGVGLSRSHWRR